MIFYMGDKKLKNIEEKFFELQKNGQSVLSMLQVLSQQVTALNQYCRNDMKRDNEVLAEKVFDMDDVMHEKIHDLFSGQIEIKELTVGNKSLVKEIYCDISSFDEKLEENVSYIRDDLKNVEANTISKIGSISNRINTISKEISNLRQEVQDCACLNSSMEEKIKNTVKEEISNITNIMAAMDDTARLILLTSLMTELDGMIGNK